MKNERGNENKQTNKPEYNEGKYKREADEDYERGGIIYILLSNRESLDP